MAQPEYLPWIWEPGMDTPYAPSPPTPSRSPSPEPSQEPPVPQPTPPKPKPWWDKNSIDFYKTLPYAIPPPEGWDAYKPRKRGDVIMQREYGTLDLPDRHDQVRRIARGEVLIGPILPLGLRSLMVPPADRCFSKQSVKDSNVGIDKYIYSRTCMIKTTPEQRVILSRWMRGAREIFNATVAAVEGKKMPLNMSALMAAFATSKPRKRKVPEASTRSLRPNRGTPMANALNDTYGDDEEDKSVDDAAHAHADADAVVAQYGTGHLLREKPYLNNVPSVVRSNAVLDVLKSYESMHAKVAKGGRGGKLHFRSAQRSNFVIISPSKKEGYSSFTRTPVPPSTGDRRKKHHMDIHLGHGLGPLRVRQLLPLCILQHNIVLFKNRRGKFYMRYCLEKSVHSLPSLPQVEKRVVIGLDPGVKSFITAYDADTGAHQQYGGGDHGSDKLRALVTKSRQ